MYRDIVEYVTTEKIDIRLPLQDAFYFQPKGRFIWLQKLAWRFIAKQNGLKQAHTFKTDLKIDRIDTRDFMERLFKQRADLFDNYGKRPKKLLIGHKTFEELMAATYERGLFNFSSNFYSADINGNRQIHGLDVEIIPWMEGMVVMP